MQAANSQASREQLILNLIDRPDSVIRDTVWGDIRLPREVLALLDSKPFQRLRRVQQLGFTSWTFPGAHHTRFEHCVGVYNLTRTAILHLLRRGGINFTQEEVNTTLAAGLLHDIGHYPFSHAVEELDVNVVRNHEIIGRELVLGDEIGGILREQWGVDPAKVAAFITKDSETPLNRRELALRQLISGALDTDKLDYLTRDSRYCNVPYGMVDVQRLIDSLRVYPDTEPEDLSIPLQLVIDEKGVGALQSLIFARYLMFYNVYWHHTNRIATVMFLRSLQDALELGVFGAAELEHSDDDALIGLIQRTTPPESIANTLITDLYNRRFYKRALVFSEDDSMFMRLASLKFNPRRRKRLEELWCQLVGEWTGRQLRGHEILLDIPEPKGFELVLNVVCEQPPHGWQNPLPWGEVSGLNNDDMRKFHRHVRRMYIVAKDNELVEVVRTKAAALIDAYRQVERE